MSPPDPDRRVILRAATAVSALGVPVSARAQPRIVMNDASRLSPTPVVRHWIARPDPQERWIAELRDTLRRAAVERRPVVVGAARHSMGGQSLARDGYAITFDADRCEVDRAAGIARVQAGMRWHQVIERLDPLGLSPAVMQSNSDFSVGATFSVNAHGWPAPYGPFGSTVRAIRLMLADGTIVGCSRTENAELFALAMGGYGLVGVLLDLDIEVVRNRLMRPRWERMPAGELAGRFVRTLREDREVAMIYGRLNVSRDDLLSDGVLVTWRPDPTPPDGLPPAVRSGALTGVSREIYRAQIGSEAAKKARWLAETVALPKAGSGAAATRNRLMNEPVSNLEGRDRRRTDILHEYFVPPERFDEFLAACRTLIRPARAEFLNVTLRWVAADDTPVLGYCGSDRIAAVMSFSQEISPEGEADMIMLTEAPIERVAAIGGAYYLPYRLHARPEQFRAVYPQAERFAARKHHHDPRLVFRHALWDAYLAG